MDCNHTNFVSSVEVNRLIDRKQFITNIKVSCLQCGLPFEFLGLNPGLDLEGATCSVDGLEARIAISPKGQIPNPLQRMMYGIGKFES